MNWHFPPSTWIPLRINSVLSICCRVDDDKKTLGVNKKYIIFNLFLVSISDRWCDENPLYWTVNVVQNIENNLWNRKQYYLLFSSMRTLMKYMNTILETQPIFKIDSSTLSRYSEPIILLNSAEWYWNVVNIDYSRVHF